MKTDVVGYCASGQDEPGIEGSRFSPTALYLFLGSVAIYVLSGGVPVVPQGDYAAASYIPLSVLRERDLDLDEYAAAIGGEPSGGYTILRTHTHYLSATPIGTPLLAVPTYAIAAPLVRDRDGGWSPQAVSFLGKLAASVIVAASVALVYLTAARLSDHRTALMVAILYALGTPSWAISSRSLWQHGGAQVSLVLALYALVRASRRPTWIGWAGLAASFAVLCRPSMLVAWLVLCVYVVATQRRQTLRYVLFSVPPVLLLLWYNTHYFGAPWRTGYTTDAYRWDGIMAEALPGLLLSPGRGLLVYTPAFLLCLVSIILVLRRWKKTLARYYLGVAGLALSYLLLMARWWCWWGGACWGYRRLLDVVPALALLTTPAIQVLARIRMRWVAVFLILLSIGINWLKGAEPVAEMGWKWNLFALSDWSSQKMLWSWKHSPISCQGVGMLATRLGIAQEAWDWYSREDGFGRYCVEHGGQTEGSRERALTPPHRKMPGVDPEELPRDSSR